MPKKKQSTKSRPKSFYKSPPPKSSDGRAVLRRRPNGGTPQGAADTQVSPTEEKDFVHAKPIPSAHFTLREDGSIHLTAETPRRRDNDSEEKDFAGRPQDLGGRAQAPSAPPRLIFSSENPFLRLYHGNCLELLDAIAAKYPEGRFDAIFADPPYFLSNGGISCHAGRMVKVDKGDWDKSRGPELNHEFNTEWLKRCQKVLKPNGTIWVSGTHHVIFSIGYQQCKKE